ncbi:MAG TPA: hypothetical protein VFY23_03445 [Candidatus Limnocylindrales bacterium]|nr:hypothetical protein [Candidatus Limnocylindrales bacterium]
MDVDLARLFLQGVDDIAEVELAAMEGNGEVSAIRRGGDDGGGRRSRRAGGLR